MTRRLLVLCLYSVVLLHFFTSVKSAAVDPGDANTNADTVRRSETQIQPYPQNKVDTPESDTSPQPTTTTTTLSATNDPTTTVYDPLRDDAIMGCRWPDDFLQRYRFCLAKSNLKVGASNDSNGSNGDEDIQYGILSRSLLDFLLGSCTKDTLDKCVRQISDKKLDAFIAEWFTLSAQYKTFEDCLQQNTEAMNRLCGANSEVARVVSGAAGLQLNLLNILVRMKEESVPMNQANQQPLTVETLTNSSRLCYRAVAASVHVTAALYVQSKHYMDNSVLCWNVVTQNCPKECAAFAAELNCLESKCTDVLSQNLLKEFGIWQWYFLNSKKARDQCGIHDEKCTVTDEGTSDIVVTGVASLFDKGSWKRKIKKFQQDVEQQLNLPFSTVAAVTVSIFFGFLASVTLLCMWRYGLLCGGGGEATRRYSRLNEGERFEDERKSLTRAMVDADDME